MKIGSSGGMHTSPARVGDINELRMFVIKSKPSRRGKLVEIPVKVAEDKGKADNRLPGRIAEICKLFRLP